MLILDRLLIGGITFVLRRIADAVDAEMNDVDTLHEELLAAQMRLELGEIGEAEFAALEREVLARLREIRERDGGDGPTRIAGIDVSVADGLDDDPPGRSRPR